MVPIVLAFRHQTFRRGHTQRGRQTQTEFSQISGCRKRYKIRYGTVGLTSHSTRHIIGHFGDDFTGQTTPNQQCHSTEGRIQDTNIVRPTMEH